MLSFAFFHEASDARLKPTIERASASRSSSVFELGLHFYETADSCTRVRLLLDFGPLSLGSTEEHWGREDAADLIAEVSSYKF